MPQLTSVEPESRPTGPTPTQMAPGSKLVLVILVVSTFVVILNETIMSVALPRLMTALDVTASSAQWLTTGFLLTMAVVIPVSGFLLQRLHIRTVFIGAMSAFTLGTLIAATAPGFEVLLAGRVVQAVGTALMIPLLTTTVLNLVPADRRGQMMGVVSIVIAVAPAIGPTVSGVVLSSLDWHWMFWLMLPIALSALTLGAVFLRNVTVPTRVPLDIGSVGLSILAFGGVVYGLSSIGSASTGSASVAPWIPLAIAVVALALFIWRQLSLQRDDRALLDLRTFATPTFRIAVGLMAVTMMALFGSLIVLPLFLQQVLGRDVLTTGLLLLPGGVLMGVLSPFVGRLFDRFGPRRLVVPGAVILSSALWGMTTLTQNTPIVAVIGVHCLMSAGMAFLMTPLMTSALGALPQTLYAHGSAIVSTVQQLAGAAGTAVFITLMTSRTASAIAEGITGSAAVEAGVNKAFTYGALISLLAIVGAFFVRKPAPAGLSTLA